jgi:hypothetical protein
VRQDVGDEAAHADRALLRGAQSVGHPEQRQALGVQRLEVDLGLQHVVDVADRGVPAFVG